MVTSETVGTLYGSGYSLQEICNYTGLNIGDVWTLLNQYVINNEIKKEFVKEINYGRH